MRSRVAENSKVQQKNVKLVKFAIASPRSLCIPIGDRLALTWPIPAWVLSTLCLHRFINNWNNILNGEVRVSCQAQMQSIPCRARPAGGDWYARLNF